MVIEIIPDKICKKCGGNRWSIYSREYWRNICRKQVVNLSDNYVKMQIATCYKREYGEIIRHKDIPQEIVDEYRKAQENNRTIREFKILRQMETITSRTEELKSLNDMTAEEKRLEFARRQRMYTNTYMAKKKLTQETLNKLEEVSINGVQKNNFSRSEAMKKRWAEVKATKSSVVPVLTSSSSLGTLEMLFNDLKNLTLKKQEILNHIEAIKQLVNQF